MSHPTQQHASTSNRKEKKSKGHYALYFPKWHGITRRAWQGYRQHESYHSPQLHTQHRLQANHAHASTIYGGKFS